MGKKKKFVLFKLLLIARLQKFWWGTLKMTKKITWTDQQIPNNKGRLEQPGCNLTVLPGKLLTKPSSCQIYRTYSLILIEVILAPEIFHFTSLANSLQTVCGVNLPIPIKRIKIKMIFFSTHCDQILPCSSSVFVSCFARSCLEQTNLKYFKCVIIYFHYYLQFDASKKHWQPILDYIIILYS